VLLAYDLPRCRLKIVFRPHRCGAKRALPVIKDGKQAPRDRIAGVDYLAWIYLDWATEPCNARNSAASWAAALAWAAGAEEEASLRSASTL
jgi:hypothetical protein